MFANIQIIGKKDICGKGVPPTGWKEVMASGGSVFNGFEKVQNWDPHYSEPKWEIIPSQVMAPYLDDWSPDQGDEINPPSADGNPDVGFRPVRWTF